MIRCYESGRLHEEIYCSSEVASHFVNFVHAYASEFGAINHPIVNERSFLIIYAFGASGIGGVARFAVTIPPRRPNQDTLPMSVVFARTLLTVHGSADDVRSALIQHYVLHHLEATVSNIFLADGNTPRYLPEGWVSNQNGLLIRIPVVQKKSAGKQIRHKQELVA